MSRIGRVGFSGGYVSTGTGARDASSLEPGELVTMEGAYYRKNDPTQAWKMPGRSLFGSAGSTKVKGLALCQFDDGAQDALVAAIGTTLVKATPGTSGTFSSLVTGLNTSFDTLTACQQNDRWYLGNGYDANRCLKPDGTVRLMGMQGPSELLTLSASSLAGATALPTANTGAFNNPTYAYDAAGAATYSHALLSAPGPATHTWDTWGSDASTNRSLSYKWKLAGYQTRSGGSSGSGRGGVGTGGSVDSGFSVTVLFEMYNGTSWSTIYSSTLTAATAGAFTSSVARIADAINSNLVKFRATLTYNSGTNQSSLRIYDVRIDTGSTVTARNTSGAMFYSYTEFNATDNLEGPPSDVAELAAQTSKNLVTITRPTTAVNAAATHWRVYRSVPGAADTIDSMGVLFDVPIASTVAYDDWSKDPDTQLTDLIPALTIGELSIPLNTPPPTLISMVSWNGSIVGISRETSKLRTLRYSEAGFPEAWPEFYVVSSFPIDEHDVLVGQMAVGETLILLMEGAVLALDGLPRVVDGQFQGANARPLKGHPGCVGRYAYTTFSVAGEPRGAWVSPFGIYITNGQVSACITTDLAWESEVSVPDLGTCVLKFDQKNAILWFEYDSDGGGTNDAEMPIHMAELHSKGESRPKLGGPTTKATNCMAGGSVGSTPYRYSGHPSNGGVYLEESGTTDAATEAAVEMVIRTGQIDNDKVDMGIVKATLNHSDFGDGSTGTLVVTAYRDSSDSDNSRSQSIALDGNRGTTVGVGRAGELFDFEFSYGGTGTGGVGGVVIEVDGQGRSGSAARWVSASATP